MQEPTDPAYSISWDTILSVIKRRKYLGAKPAEELSVEDLIALKPLLNETLNERIDDIIEETIDVYELELNL